MGLKPASWHALKETRTHVNQCLQGKDELAELITERTRVLMERAEATTLHTMSQNLTTWNAWAHYLSSPLIRLQQGVHWADPELGIHAHEAPRHKTGEIAAVIRTLKEDCAHRGDA